MRLSTFLEITSNVESKPYELLEQNVEFLQNKLCSNNEIIKTLIETQVAVLRRADKTSFHNSALYNVDQLTQQITPTKLTS